MKDLPSWTKFLPVKFYEIDADTGKPTDPNVGRKVHVTYYDVKKKKNGSKIIEKHKSPSPSAHGGSKKKEDAKTKHESGKKDPKKDDGEKKEKEGVKKDEKKDQVKKDQVKKDQVKKDQVKKDQVKKDEKTVGGRADDKPAPPEQEWTAEEDAKLRHLKGSNTPWAKIGEQLAGRPKWQLTARWKEIQGKPVPSGRGGGGGEEKKKDEKEKEKKKEQPQSAGAGEGEERKKGKKTRPSGADENQHPTHTPHHHHHHQPPAPATPPKPSSHPHPHHYDSTRQHDGIGIGVGSGNENENENEARFTLSEWQALQSDDLFSLAELQCLSHLIMRDTHATWLRIAAHFYDKTGRRVHPDDIREKFEQMAGMACL